MQTEQSTCTAISPVVVDLFEQPAEKANNNPSTYSIDIHHQTLLRDCQGEILMVGRGNGITDIFCRNQHSGKKRLRHAALWFATMAKNSNARFFAGEMTSKGVLFRTISWDEVIERMCHWVFKEIL